MTDEIAQTWDRLYARGSISDAIDYERLMCPGFRDVDEMVFRRAARREQPDLDDPTQTLDSLGGDRMAVEMGLQPH